MKALTDFAQSNNAVLELATLSRDPALTFRPDPRFRAQFRNPDEIIEGEYNSVDMGVHTVGRTPMHWRGAASWRRSPKD